MSGYLTFTDEQLEEYLAIWYKLIERGNRERISITLEMDFKWSSGWRYTVTYGEERRDLTREQAWRVKEWLDSLKRFTPTATVNGGEY